MRSVSNVFKMSVEDPTSSHVTKYTMNMKPSAFSDTRSKKSEKYNCFVVCKDMRQSFYLLKVLFYFYYISSHKFPISLFSFPVQFSLLISKIPISTLSFRNFSIYFLFLGNDGELFE